MKVKSILLFMPKARNISVGYFLGRNIYLGNFLLHENGELRICHKEYPDPYSCPNTQFRCCVENVYLADSYLLCISLSPSR